MWHPEGGSGLGGHHAESWVLKLRESIIQITKGKIMGKETRRRPEYPSLPSLHGYRAGVERDELSEKAKHGDKGQLAQEGGPGKRRHGDDKAWERWRHRKCSNRGGLGAGHQPKAVGAEVRLRS